MNLYSFSGNVGQDATLRYTQNSKSICQFSVGVSTGYGENRKTVWARCSVWDKQAELANDAFKKGVRFNGYGEITATSYVDKEGNEKPSLEIRVIGFDLPPRDKNESGDTSYQPKENNAPKANNASGKGAFDDFVDEPLPF